jgi:hypothetical protein
VGATAVTEEDVKQGEKEEKWDTCKDDISAKIESCAADPSQEQQSQVEQGLPSADTGKVKTAPCY